MSFVQPSSSIQLVDLSAVQRTRAFSMLATLGERGADREQLRREVEEYFDGHVDVRAGDVVVDVGANVGAFALAVALRTASRVRLLCVEPAPRTFEALHTSFERVEELRRTRHVLERVALGAPRDHGLRRDLFFFSRLPCDTTLELDAKRQEFERYFDARGAAWAAAIGRAMPNALGRAVARLAHRTIAALPRGPLGWWVSQRVTGMRRERVEVRTLRSLLRRESIERVDLLKIDVEGAELDVLEGLGRGGLSCVRQVAIETVAERAPEIERRLHEGGFLSVRVRPTADGLERGLANVLVTATRARP